MPPPSQLLTCSKCELVIHQPKLVYLVTYGMNPARWSLRSASSSETLRCLTDLICLTPVWASVSARMTKSSTGDRILERSKVHCMKANASSKHKGKLSIASRFSTSQPTEQIARSFPFSPTRSFLFCLLLGENGAYCSVKEEHHVKHSLCQKYDQVQFNDRALRGN